MIAAVLLALGGIAICMLIGAASPGVAAASGQRLAAATPSSSAAASGAETVVHVSGQVQRPGVYRLPAGARVADAVDMAGGALDDADLAAVNLARKATDGEQIHVPALGEGGGTGGEGTSIAQAGPAAGGKVNLNQATAEQLDALPRIGPSTAAKIVAEREANGPFASVDDLERVSGIGAKTVDGLRDLATV